MGHKWKQIFPFNQPYFSNSWKIFLLFFLIIFSSGCAKPTDENLFYTQYANSDEEKEKVWKTVYFACFVDKSKKQKASTLFSIVWSVPKTGLNLVTKPIFGKNKKINERLSEEIKAQLSIIGHLDENITFTFEEKCKKHTSHVTKLTKFNADAIFFGEYDYFEETETISIAYYLSTKGFKEPLKIFQIERNIDDFPYVPGKIADAIYFLLIHGLDEQNYWRLYGLPAIQNDPNQLWDLGIDLINSSEEEGQENALKALVVSWKLLQVLDETDPFWIDAKFLKSVVLLNLNRTEEAIAEFAPIADQHPDSRLFYETAGEQYFQNSLYGDAWQVFYSIFQREGPETPPWIYYRLGQTVILRSTYDETQKVKIAFSGAFPFFERYLEANNNASEVFFEVVNFISDYGYASQISNFLGKNLKNCPSSDQKKLSIFYKNLIMLASFAQISELYGPAVTGYQCGLRLQQMSDIGTKYYTAFALSNIAYINSNNLINPAATRTDPRILRQAKDNYQKAKDLYFDQDAIEDFNFIRSTLFNLLELEIMIGEKASITELFKLLDNPKYQEENYQWTFLFLEALYQILYNYEFSVAEKFKEELVQNQINFYTFWNFNLLLLELQRKLDENCPKAGEQQCLAIEFALQFTEDVSAPAPQQQISK